MGFYRSNPKMQAQLLALMNQFSRDGRPGLQNSVSITWIRYPKPNPEPLSGIGANWSGEKLIYPASIVKLFYAIAAEAWIQKGLLLDGTEIREAIKNMIAHSSNDATSLVMDLLSGTTSGPQLINESMERWTNQRNLVNKWLQSLKWEENEGVNCCQKTWTDGPYGREKEFYGEGRSNQNLLSTESTAKMLEAVMTNNIVSPPACKRIQKIMSRSLEKIQREQDPENQIDGFLGEGLKKGTMLWSKAGWMSKARHDATWCNIPKGNPMLIIVFCHGRELSKDEALLPGLARELQKIHLSDDEIE